jgi:prophage tail gpP-like protein
MANIYALTGQFAVRDEKSMRKTSEMQAKAEGTMPNVYRFLETVTEQPVGSEAELQKRATYEALQREGTQVRAFVTVQGWLRDGTNLWHTRDNVLIKSPMCPLDLALKIQSATFTQDNKGGTTTLLECVLPWMLNDRLYQLGGAKGSDQPKAPAPAKSTSDSPAAASSPLLGTAEPPSDL